MKKLNHIITVLLLTATGHAYAQTADRDTLFLEESVVIGMDVQKRNTITAAVFTVKADAVSGRPVTDLTHALQGNVPGLVIVTDAMENGTGGEPGAGVRFNIRGTGSVNGGEP